MENELQRLKDEKRDREEDAGVQFSGQAGIPVRIRNFAGKPGDDFLSWIDRFELAAQASQWGEDRKVEILPYFLIGKRPRNI